MTFLATAKQIARRAQSLLTLPGFPFSLLFDRLVKFLEAAREMFKMPTPRGN
jgi:hypothetical protein